MTRRPPVFVTGMGVVCAGANNVAELRNLLAVPEPRFRSPTVFSLKGAGADLPVAQALDLPDNDMPRTHQLALMAAREAVGNGPAPDAIVLGTTTGGILATETALEANVTSPGAYRFHGLDTVALHLARSFVVGGPVITVSTACSSAAVALSIAAALIRAGLATRVLSGGADSLCRLTFHGFRQLQLVAPGGCAPLDVERAGMTVGEGAGFLLLESAPQESLPLAVLSGAGLSCDAYHATSPHPEGKGAILAMQRALLDAGALPPAIGYINLHGTGTVDNDAAEARAIKQVFASAPPALSSTKGLTGHALAAAGAIEAVISVLALQDGLLPANTGLGTLDPSLGIEPVRAPARTQVSAVLSNSFGFGGNNACVVFEKAAVGPSPQPSPPYGHFGSITPIPTPRGFAAPSPAFAGRGGNSVPALRVAASACLTARGGLDETWVALLAGQPAAGFVPDAAFAKAAPAAFLRRLKRLPRLMIALARNAHLASSRTAPPEVIAVGTAWGPLHETRDFLRKLFETGDQFSSPMDFIGSVHNAPAGQVALLLGAQSPNLTCSSAERSFEQALLCASLLTAAGAGSALVMAAEAFEATLSPLFEPQTAQGPLASDGGAAFVLLPDDGDAGARLRWLGERDEGLPLLERIAVDGYDAVIVNSPMERDLAGDVAYRQLNHLHPAMVLITCRDRLGQHRSISATVAAVAARAVLEGALPFAETPIPLPRKRVLLLNLGARATAIEVFA